MLILLPSVVPPSFGKTITTLVVDERAQTYQATVGLTPDCRGYTVCTEATIDGRRGRVNTAGRRRVVLRDGTVAWFEQHPCAANCAGSATLVFHRGSMQYTVSIKAGILPEAILIANGLRAAQFER